MDGEESHVDQRKERDVLSLFCVLKSEPLTGSELQERRKAEVDLQPAAAYSTPSSHRTVISPMQFVDFNVKVRIEHKITRTSAGTCDMYLHLHEHETLLVHLIPQYGIL